MRKNKLYTPIIALLIIASLAAIGPTSAQVPNSVYVDPASVTADVGQAFSISVMAFEVSGVNSYEIRLDYDTAILDATTAVVGDFITGSVLPFVTIDDVGGKVTLGLLNLDPLQAVSGSGLLGTIDFTVTGIGSSVLDIGLYNSGPGEPHNWLLDTASLQIPHESANGLFSNVVEPDKGILTISTEPVAGEIFVDGVSVGTGSYSAEVEVGTYLVSFGDVAGYYTPADVEAIVVKDQTTTVVGTYEPIPIEVHDVAVTALLAPATANVGDLVSISVDVANLGDFDETADVTVTVDGMSLGTQQVVLTLAAPTATLGYSWDTAGSMAGEYTITATATIPIDDVPGNNEMTATITLKEVVMYLARLVGKSAWPEHHHYTAKDEDVYQTLFAKVRNIGEMTTNVRVEFTIDAPNAADIVVTTDPIPVDPTVNRGIGYVQVDFMPTLIGKHYVTAICQYEVAPGVWVDSTIKVKTFSFAVASLK